MQLLLCQGMPVPAVSQFQNHWTDVNSTLGDSEPALLTVHTFMDTSTLSKTEDILNL